MADTSSKNDLWLSANNLSEKNKVKKQDGEFRQETVENFDLQNESVLSRRKFLALLSASAALTATACSDYRDKGSIVPYNKRPEEVLPGTANYYASTCSLCTNNCGIIVKTREGRPIKIDGNNEHKVNKGKICASGQSSILNLYDPNRLKNPLYNKKEISWENIDAKIVDVLNDAKKRNIEIAIITNNTTSQSEYNLLNEFSLYYNATIYSYLPFENNNYENALINIFNTDKRPTIKYNSAKIVVSFENDFLGKGDNLLENISNFTKNRDVDNIDTFNRLYSIEGNLSLTGSNADYRIAISPEKQLKLLYSIIGELIKRGFKSNNIPERFIANIKKYSLNNVINELKINSNVIQQLINDIVVNSSKTVFVINNNFIPEFHHAAFIINQMLNNFELFDFGNSNQLFLKNNSNEDFKILIEKINNGKIGAVINYNSDPIFHFGSNIDFKTAYKKLKNVITFCEELNDTAELSTFVLPINHQLESWGIYNSKSNVYSFQQPVISPIFNTRQKEGILEYWMTNLSKKYDEFSYYNYVRTFFNKEIYPLISTSSNSTDVWNNCLHDGIMSLTAPVNSPIVADFSKIPAPTVVEESKFTVLLEKNYFILDGKLANNGWLQEIPHPISKIMWDNYAAISPNTAKKYNLELNDVVELSYNNKKIEIAVCVQPGVADNLAVIELGYGRDIIGEVGKDVGVNANKLIDYNTINSFLIKNVKIVKTGKTYDLATSQEHHPVDDPLTKELHRSRNIIQEGTVIQYKKNPKFIEQNKPEVFSISSEKEYKDVKWAMSIDLNKCIGCAVCVASCNVENNIPVVGKDQTERGREMQWMRIDRYYSGNPDNPIVSNQPMLCQHCDNAPCENVCPVNATNHSDDGLNQMTYNRCVGTRYCSNNCPYKVRRFNFYNFRDHFEDAYYDNELTGLLNNPEVTVRSRGVMEKCTFCIQRIMESRQEAIMNNIPITEIEVTTACQQACPSNAIVFGNANNKNQEINKVREHELGYHVLESLNIKPNVTYIAKLRNIQSEEI